METNFAKTLKQLRKNMDVTQAELATALALGKSTISMYEVGEREPDFETLEQIAAYFQVDMNYLLGRDPIPFAKAQPQKSTRIPVLGSIPAGIPLEAIEDIYDYEEIPAEWTAGNKEYFALKIQGNSMYPKYLENDIVIFLKTPDCDSGTDSAVIVNGDNATFKKVVKQSGGIVLQPLNSVDFEPIFYSNEEIEQLPVSILGIAKEIRRKP